MKKTDLFRTQHKEIAALVGEIEQKLSPVISESDGDVIRKSLSSLSGKLMIHLAMEDRNLYPAIVTSGDENAKKMAETFMTEMGTLAGAFKDYTGKWPSGATIAANPADFCTQTKAVFGALKDRVGREEATLYPLADTL